jgi:hypothetical protein
MSAFNVVHLHWHDPQTNKILDINVQFKYGDTWQYEYEVGDILKWGGNDIGIKDVKHVVVFGALENDHSEVPEDFEVHIVDGKIEKVIPVTGDFDFVHAKSTFIVLDE